MSSFNFNDDGKLVFAKIAALAGLLASGAACNRWMPPDSMSWLTVIFVSVTICAVCPLVSAGLGLIATLSACGVLLVAQFVKLPPNPLSKEESGPLVQEQHPQPQETRVEEAPIPPQPPPKVAFDRNDVEPPKRSKKGLGPYGPIKHSSAPKKVPAFDPEPRSSKSKGKTKKGTKPKTVTVAYQSSKRSKAGS